MSTRDRARARIVAIFKRHYGDSLSDEQILAADPNEYDQDPAAFYDDLAEAYPDADLEDVLMNSGTVAECLEAVQPKRAPSKKPSAGKDWFDLYLADLRGRAERKRTTEAEQIYTILNFRYRHSARGRRGLLAQAESLLEADPDLQALADQAKQRRLTLTTTQLRDILEKILTYAVEYPPAYPPA